jgi:hypothetical protein
MARPSRTKSHLLGHSPPGESPCWASPLAFGFIGRSRPASIMKQKSEEEGKPLTSSSNIYPPRGGGRSNASPLPLPYHHRKIHQWWHSISNSFWGLVSSYLHLSGLPRNTQGVTTLQHSGEKKQKAWPSPSSLSRWLSSQSIKNKLFSTWDLKL